MAFRWRADDGLKLNAGLVALCFFQEIWTNIAKKPNIFCDCSGVRTPCPPPSGSAHVFDPVSHMDQSIV